MLNNDETDISGQKFIEGISIFEAKQILKCIEKELKKHSRNENVIKGESLVEIKETSLLKKR